MRDLREVGQKVIDSIMKMKPSDAGDLAIGVEDIISDLRSNPAQFQEKLDHLEGLFKELAYGEEYALREKVTKDKDEDELQNLFGNRPWGTGIIPAVSGVVSGAITPGSLHSVMSPPTPRPANPTSYPLPEDNPRAEVSLDEPEECILPTVTREQLEALKTYEQEELNEEPKTKPSWWQRKLWW